MTDERSPTDRLLDLLVFAPAGLVVTVAEELPKLADRGRERVQTQVSTARLVGQFAVQFGRAELDRRFSSLLRRAPAGPEPSAGEAGVDQAAEPTASGHRAAATDPVPAPSGSPVSPAAANGAFPPVPGAEPAEAGPSSVPAAGAAANTDRAAAAGPGGDGPVPTVGELAIPGYDTLSASQVVQRLAGLSGPELGAVARYEQTHRHRRTILNRVEQLVRAAR